MRKELLLIEVRNAVDIQVAHLDSNNLKLRSKYIADIGNSGRVELKDRTHITSDRLDLKYERTYDISSTRAEVTEHNKFSSTRVEITEHKQVQLDST